MPVLNLLINIVNEFTNKLPGSRHGFILLLLSFPGAMQAQPNLDREYQLKAVFLFNFTQFVEWPPRSFSSAQSPLVIGVLGENPFGSFLEETVAGEKVNGHPVVVRQYDNIEDARASHILYINLPDVKKRERAFENLKGQPLLTISEAPEFLKQGGIIRFLKKDNKIKLQVNLEASKEK